MRNIILSESIDSDGDPVYTIQAELKSGKLVPLSIIWIQNKGVQEELIKKIKEFLDL